MPTLTKAQITERAQKLAEKVEELNRLEDAKKSAAKSFGADIKVMKREITKLSKEIVTGEEVAPELPFDEDEDLDEDED